MGIYANFSNGYGKPDQFQRVRKIVVFSFVISGSAVQIRPWAPNFNNLQNRLIIKITFFPTIFPPLGPKT